MRFSRRRRSRSSHRNAPARDPATHALTHAWRCRMSRLRSLALLFALAFLCAPAHAQDGKIAIEKFNHSEWTKGIFSEAVTVTGIGNARMVYLAGVGAEDENGARGTIRHPGNV